MSAATRRGEAGAELRRALSDFLALPGLIVAGFVALAATTTALDFWDSGVVADVRELLTHVLFARPSATSGLLAVIAGGVITIASITFSLLLLALQQSAASLTQAVFDQFLRRKLNQAYFGFFVGLAVYALVILATVNEGFNPVLGATAALVLAAASFLLLVTLIYSTVQQMRPAVIVDSIRELTLQAHERHAELVRATRRHSRRASDRAVPVRVGDGGFVTDIRLEALVGAATAAHAEIEIVSPIGGYRAYGEPVALVRGAELSDELESAVGDAIRLERTRDLRLDPRHGVEQLGSIAWTTISTSKQNPSPGIHVNLAYRDLVARLVGIESEEDAESPVVYPDVFARDLLCALESMAVVASESLQDQNFAETVRTLTLALACASDANRRAAEQSVLRILPALGELVLTTDLDDSLRDLEAGARAVGADDVAAAVVRAHSELARSVGTLASRATRVPSE